MVSIWQPGNLLGKRNILWKDYIFWRLIFARIFATSFKNFPERLSILAALSILSFHNFSTKSSVTLEKLNLSGSGAKIF